MPLGLDNLVDGVTVPHAAPINAVQRITIGPLVKNILDPTYGSAGTAATAAANSAALLAAAVGGGRVFIPAGHWSFSPFILSAIPNLEIQGAGRNATFLDFTGTATEAIRVVNCHYFVLHDVCVRMMSGTVTYAIHHTCTTSAQEGTYERILIQTSGGIYTNGMAIAADTAADVSEVTLIQVRVEGAVNAGFVAGNGTSANVLNLRAIACTSTSSAIGVNMNGAGIHWYGGTVQHNTVTDFQLAAGSTAGIVIQSVRSETSQRFLTLAGAGTTPTPVTLVGCYVAGFTDVNGFCISYAGSGSLTLIGCTFNSSSAGVRPAIILANCTAGKPLAVTVIDCTFDNDTPFVNITAACVLIAFGTRKIDGTGNTVLPTDRGAFSIGSPLVAKADFQRSRQTPTEAVLVSGVDTTIGELVSVTLTAARVVGAPLTPAIGQRLTFILTQGGAGGFAVTWNAVFKKTWADTGNTTGKISSISFVYDGTNWIQDGAQAPYV